MYMPSVSLRVASFARENKILPHARKKIQNITQTPTKVQKTIIIIFIFGNFTSKYSIVSINGGFCFAFFEKYLNLIETTSISLKAYVLFSSKVIVSVLSVYFICSA